MFHLDCFIASHVGNHFGMERLGANTSHSRIWNLPEILFKPREGLWDIFSPSSSPIFQFKILWLMSNFSELFIEHVK